MGSMNELVSKVSVNKNARAKEYAHASEWPKCSHAGCPIPATIKADNVTCRHHFREHGFSAECITEAVKEFIPYINKLNEMIFWDVKQWKERRSQIMGWPVLPATDEEMNLPTLYIRRLEKWIDTELIKRADAIYSGQR